MAVGRVAGAQARWSVVRVLIVVPWPLLSYGGSQRLAREIATALSVHQGWDVHVAAGSGPSSLSSIPVSDRGPIREIRLSLTEPRSSAWWRRRPARDTTILDGLDDVVDDVQPEVILFPGHHSSVVDQVAAVAADRRLPFAFLPAIHLDHPDHLNRAAQRAYQAADLIVCHTEMEREWLVTSGGVEADRTLVLDCGWDQPDAPRPPSQTDALRLLTVSAFSRHKQIDHQLRAVARFRDVTDTPAALTVAGTLSEVRELEALNMLARELGIDREVTFRPDCTDEELRSLHAAADYFLFTSRSESFGMAVLDAIGFGVCPVVYPHPAYGGLVKSSGFGTVAKRETSEALADALELAHRGVAQASDTERRTWLNQRTWSRTIAPLAEALTATLRTPARRVARPTRHVV